MTTAELSYRILSTKQIDEIMRIERACYPDPWSEAEIRQLLTAPECFGIGAFDARRLVGYVIWTSASTKVVLHNMAVDPECRRRGAGRGLIECLRKKVLQTKRRTRIELVVSELNLDTLKFFRAVGFRAVRTLPNHFGDDRDAYQMIWRRPPDS